MLRFVLALAATIGLIRLLTISLSVGTATLPPLGTFFNPFSGFWRNAEPVTGPVLAQNIKIPNLQGKVDVVYDDLFVPHIFAENTLDALRVQGYVTAQNRLFQMNLTVRKVAGRLSEILGERTLEVDQRSRRLGLVWAAERDLEHWKTSPENMAMLNAYCDGVNAYLAQLQPADYPIEFKLIGFAPEQWDPLKCALVVEGMADMLSGYERDLAASSMLQALGRADYDYLYPDWNTKQQPIVPDMGQWKGLKAPVSDAPNTVPIDPDLRLIEQPDPISIDKKGRDGSNNWAVAASKTANGHPLLANDPHLGLTLPSIWYQVQLHTPDFNAYGVSLPGLPGIAIGFNEHTAWGETNVGVDLSDWYKIHWTDASRTTYLIDNQPKKAETRIETILVKGREMPVVDTIRYTVWGPVSFNDPKHPLHDCALRWMLHDAPDANILETFVNLNKGKSLDDYRNALRSFDNPGQNFVFASKGGDIAIQVQGLFPIRQGEEGRFVQDGSKSSSAWRGFIPQDELPHLYNPQRGFVFSANQHSTPPSYPYYAKYGDWENYRSRRIYNRLAPLKGATVDTMKAMQLDNYSQRAADALPAMLHLLDRNGLDPIAQGYLNVLEQWHYAYDRDMVAPTLFEMWYDSTYMHTWDEITVLRDKKINVMYPTSWRFIELLERDTTSKYFDIQNTPGKETARQVVTQAFQLMVISATKTAATGSLNWGRLNGFKLPHLARLEGFGRTDVQVGGHGSAPNAMSGSHGPSWRMIVELGDQVQGIGVFPGGQSGNPGSRYYDNMVDTWAKGEYYNLLFLKQLDAAPADKIVARQTFN